MERKYLGKVYDGFKVVNYYKQNEYRNNFSKYNKEVRNNERKSRNSDGQRF